MKQRNMGLNKLVYSRSVDQSLTELLGYFLLLVLRHLFVLQNTPAMYVNSTAYLHRHKSNYVAWYNPRI